RSRAPEPSADASAAGVDRQDPYEQEGRPESLRRRQDGLSEVPRRSVRVQRGKRRAPEIDLDQEEPAEAGSTAAETAHPDRAGTRPVRSLRRRDRLRGRLPPSARILFP